MSTIIYADVIRINDYASTVSGALEQQQLGFADDSRRQMIFKDHDDNYYNYTPDEYASGLYYPATHNHHTLVSEDRSIDPALLINNSGELVVSGLIANRGVTQDAFLTVSGDIIGKRTASETLSDITDSLISTTSDTMTIGNCQVTINTDNTGAGLTVNDSTDRWMSLGSYNNSETASYYLPAVWSKSDQTSHPTVSIVGQVLPVAESGLEPIIELRAEEGNVTFANVSERPLVHVVNHETTIVSIDNDGTITASGDIHTIPYTDYYSSSTIIGWTGSLNPAVLKYKKVGNLVFVQFNLRGTSNSTAASFTLPYTPADGNNWWVGSCHSNMDNNSTMSTGDCYYANSKFNLTSTPLGSASSWTASNTKDIKGQFWFEV